MILISIILSVVFSANRFTDSNLYYQLNNSSYKIESGIDYKTIPTIKYALYSLLAPGLGQYNISKTIIDQNIREKNLKRLKRRSLLFLTLEAVSWGFNIHNKDKYKNKVSSYRKYADKNWSFTDWIVGYDQFQDSDYSYLWEENFDDGQSTWMGIGQSSHYVQFRYGQSEQIIRTTDSNFQNELLPELIEAINSEQDIYSGDYSIDIIKDQHFYENIGKYNEFFSGWVDGDLDHIEVSITEHGYHTPKSPSKSSYLKSYNRAEEFSDYAEIALLCVYFNHFISMIDALILTHKFNGNLMLSSSTVLSKETFSGPIGINLNLSINI